MGKNTINLIEVGILLKIPTMLHADAGKNMAATKSFINRSIRFVETKCMPE